MADPEQVRQLKASVEDWNKWRIKNPEIEINLNGADLRDANLTGANLCEAELSDANLSGANLSEADLREAVLCGADLGGEVLSEADLSRANLTESDLTEADLTEAVLVVADLHGANLREADLTDTDLRGANLREADLTEATLGYTTIAGIDLSKTHGLENIVHSNPSAISTNTFEFSKGEIPEVFLRGCGLSDWAIESSKLYRPDLSNQEINHIIYKIFDLRAQQAIQISPLFISYSHADVAFIEKMEKHLTRMGVRYWRDVHHATAGRLEKQIDHAMRHNPTVLLVLSEHSVNSDWVEHEARLARAIEKDLKRDVLCPIALDESWKTSNWPKRLMEQIMEYNILDFSEWETNEAFERMFSKMISGLDMFYKK